MRVIIKYRVGATVLRILDSIILYVKAQCFYTTRYIFGSNVNQDISLWRANHRDVFFTVGRVRSVVE